MGRVFSQQQIMDRYPGRLNSWKKDEEVRQIFDIVPDISPKKFGMRYTSASGLDFSIWNDFTVIEMHLDAGFDWRWSSTLDAFTTKNSSRKKHYGDLLYSDKKGGVWKKFNKWPPSTNLLAIQFKVRQKKGKKDSHPFSLNIDLLQPNGGWLPITIDPDVRNPPIDDPLVPPALTTVQDGDQEFYFFDSGVK